MSELINPQVLRALREAKGWNQKTLARIANVDPSVISRLECGLQDDMRVSILVALADALETSTDVLLTTTHQHTSSDALPELATIIHQLGQLPHAHQRHVAAILRAYLLALPDA